MDLQAKQLAEALFALIDAKEELQHAKSQVPSYTGDLSREDYYATEQVAYNIAERNFAEAIRNTSNDMANLISNALSDV